MLFDRSKECVHINVNNLTLRMHLFLSLVQKYKPKAKQNIVLYINSADYTCSLYKLRLKSAQTTHVVCTDLAECCTFILTYTIFLPPTWDHYIIRNSLRYFRHSGPVIYISKLPAPSASMPCDYRILQSPTKEQVKFVLLETVGRSLLGIFQLPKTQIWASNSPSLFRAKGNL